MFTRIISATSLMVTAAMASAFMPVPFLLKPAPLTPEPLAGQIFIKVKAGKESTVSSLTKKLKGKVKRSIPHIGWQLVALPAGLSYQQAEAKYRANANVLNVCPNYEMHGFDVAVNDPMFAQQYSMRKMRVPSAWDYSVGSANTVVAVLDSGVDYTHPDLKNKVVKGYDFIANDADPMDVHGHGTHVAGIVSADTNNGVGVAGIGNKTTILAVRVLGDNGSGDFDALASAIVYAADKGANIINMSLGAAGLAALPVVDDAIAYAYDTKNVLLIASAGNSGGVGNPINYPSYNSTIIAVGASDDQDGQSDFSEFNPVDGSDNWVDVAAPGVQILSTVMGGKYESWDGTSMASPNVAGVASLIWSMYSELGTAPTNTEIRRLLEENADDIGPWVNNGRINALKSLLNVGIPVADLPLPTVPAPYDGTVTYTNGSISATDGVSASIQSIRKPGIGLTGSFTTTFDMDSITMDELRTAKLTLNATAEKLATLQVFLKDHSGTWKMLASQPGNPSGKATDFTVTKADLEGHYMTADGKLNVMVRSFVPLRLANRVKGLAKVDLLQVKFMGVRRPGATP